jgi:hypothetical protein
MKSFKIHTFDNSVKVYDSHLIDIQRQRYKIVNLQEPKEENVFTIFLLATCKKT